MIKICLQCSEEYEAKRYSRKFCSRSCSATYNNPRKDSRSDGLICPKCGGKRGWGSKQCGDCRNLETVTRFGERLLSDVQLNNSASRAKNNQVRRHARRVMGMSGKPFVCEVCGWDHTVQVCHIVGIGEFDPHSTLIKEINTLENLIYLCPNHHAMLDTGDLGI